MINHQPSEKPAMPSNDDSRESGEVRWVDTADLVPGPIRRESLADDQVRRARAVYEALHPYVSPTFEQFELNFLRDADPESEIQVWENIAYAFQRYEESNGPLDESAEATLFKSLLMISMGAPKPAQIPEADWSKLLAIYDGRE